VNLLRTIRGLFGAAVHVVRAAGIPWHRLGVGAVVCGGLGTGAFFALRPDLWLVEHVVFVGSSRIREAELRHLLDLPNGTAIWAVDAPALQEALERHPWVRRAHVSLSLPDTVHVEIEERTAAALLHDGEHLLYVDREGTPFLPADFRTGAMVDLDLVHLTGMGSELVELHPELAPRAIRDGLWLVHALDERGLVSAARVSEVAFSRTSGYTVVAPPSRLLFGLADLPAQVDRLERLVHAGVSLDEPRSVDLAPATVAIVRPLLAATSGTPSAPPLPGGG
jgi:hypothetical protein